MTPEDALTRSDGSRVAVTGFLVGRDGGDLFLCSELAESDPPQCAAAGLPVRGLALDRVAGLRRAPDGAVWTDRPVRIEGTLAAGALTDPEASN